MSQAIVYLIRHGEKPEPEADGLSAQGLTRAAALPGVFGPQSSYNIKYILAEHPKKGEFAMSALPNVLNLFTSSMPISDFLMYLLTIQYE
jgi:hypothetical protein